MCENCSSQTFSLLTLRSNAAQAILSQPSPNFHTPLEVQAFCHHFPSIQHPAYSQIYLRKLTILPFPVLGNAKATLYPETNSMLLKQKHLLKWGWLCWRNTYKDFCLQLHFHHCVSVVTHLLTPQRNLSAMLPLATSPIISAHSTIKHTASYKWPRHTGWTSRRYKHSKVKIRSPADMSEWAECSPLVQGQGLKPQLILTAGAPTGLPARSYETGISHQFTKKLYQVDLIETRQGKRNPISPDHLLL